eukprot:9496575-Pyramimonas_sp.AAC.1
MLAVEYSGYVPNQPWSHASARGNKGVTCPRQDMMPVREQLCEGPLLKDMAVLVISNESRTQCFLRSSLNSLGAEGKMRELDQAVTRDLRGERDTPLTPLFGHS